jgi:FdhD protein
LFCGGELWISVEDVSRRNALDTVCGWMALHGISGAEMILYTTGRLTAEVIIKAALSGIATVVSRKGITASCCDLAEKLAMNLFGHAARGRYICYAGLERFHPQS